MRRLTNILDGADMTLDDIPKDFIGFVGVVGRKVFAFNCDPSDILKAASKLDPRHHHEALAVFWHPEPDSRLIMARVTIYYPKGAPRYVAE